MPATFDLILPLIALGFGVAVGWWLSRGRGGESMAALQARFEALEQQSLGESARLQAELAQARSEAVQALSMERARGEQHLAALRAELRDESAARLAAQQAAAEQRLADERSAAEQRLTDSVARGERLLAAEQSRSAEALQASRAQAIADLAAERERHQAVLGQLDQVRAELAQTFEVLAQKVLEQRAQTLSQQSQTNLQTLLQPLSLQIGEFKTKVEEVYRTEGLERSALKQQVEELARLNQTLRSDAQNLTEALKGSAKTRGNWGELMLGRVLEMAGLSEGTHYDVQVSHSTDESRVQPDVVVHLPGDRHLVIDAKVSLVAWDQVHAAGDEPSRDAAQRAHVESVRQHIRGLSDKNYQNLYQMGSLDFVLMFVPIESAFMLAIGRDDKLFQEAWSRNVLLVSPSTLLFVVRTVAHLWRQEDQNRNALLIAERGAALLDKFAGMAESLNQVGEKLDQARSAYDSTLTRLGGNGGLLRQTDQLRELGIKASKTVPDKLRKRVAALEATTPGEMLPLTLLDTSESADLESADLESADLESADSAAEGRGSDYPGFGVGSGETVPVGR